MSAVFVFGTDGDVMVFVSETAAAGWMEAVDVDDGEYSGAYLLDGTVLAISTERERVVLRRTDTTDLTGLLDGIRAYQRQNGRPEQVDDLVGFANFWLRRDWEQRWPRRPRWLARRFPGKGPRQVEPR